MNMTSSTPAPILITGAGGGRQGATGNRVAELLRERGFPVRAFVHRQGEQASRLASLGAEVVQGDLLDIASVRAAMQGARSAYFAYQVKDGLLDATATFAALGKEAGLELVVNLSQLNAGDSQAPSPRTRQHWLSEQVFDWAGIGATHLRAAVFYENIRRQAAEAVAAEGKMFLPIGDATNIIPVVAAEDVARAAANILSNPSGHQGKVYPIMGQTATPGGIAALLSEILGKPVEYVDVPDARWREMAEAREGSDNPLQIEHLSKLWLTIKLANEYKREFDPRTIQSLRQLLGAEPESLDHFLRENAPAFTGAAV